MPDTSHLPDLAVDKVELIPQYAILGNAYKIKIWLKEYPRLGQKTWARVVKENTFAPALLRRTDKFEIPNQWQSHGPEIVINYPAEQIIDLGRQQKKRLTITLDITQTVNEKKENNNTFVYDYGLYPAHTRMADLIFFDHPIHNKASESQYYYKSESPNFEKHVNQPVKIWGYITNIGNDIARPFSIRMIGDDDRDKRTKFTKIIRVPKQLATDEIYVFSTYATWSTPGLKVCNFELDINGEVIESNESNNNSTITCTLRIAP